MDTAASLCKGMLDDKEINCSLIQTNSLEEAVKDADYVIAQVRVGKLDARIRDENIIKI